MLLHKECLPTQLQQPVEQSIIAATFNDCNGDPLTPGVQLAKCSDIPAAAAPQTLSISGNTVSLSGGGGSIVVPDTQDLSLSGNVLSLTNGGSVTLPAGADAQTLSISGNTLSIAGGNSVTLPAAAAQDPYATPAQTIAGTATALIVNPADLFARENIPAQTGVSNDVTAIPAPTANQSNWAVNQLGETLHYAPGLGWKIVDNRYGATATYPADVSIPNGVVMTFMSHTMPRAGKIVVTGDLMFQGNDGNSQNNESTAIYLSINGVLKARFGGESANPGYNAIGVREISGSATNITVAAGDVISLDGQAGFSSGFVKAKASLSNFSYSYL